MQLGELAAAPAALSWIALPDADFTTAPRHSGLTGNISNAGNLPENRVAGLGTSVTGISWDAGDVLWLRWSTLNYPSSDSGLAMNDFRIHGHPRTPRLGPHRRSRRVCSYPSASDAPKAHKTC